MSKKIFTTVFLHLQHLQWVASEKRDVIIGMAGMQNSSEQMC
jgi:hypothetical protein